MENVLVVGKRFVPLNDVALIEAFDAEANPRFQPAQEFKARVVLLNRDSVLALETVEALATQQGFRFLPDDQVGMNPAVRFGIERFTPGEGFAPSKPFQSRLRWRDADGNEQSKLLLAAPEALVTLMTGTGAELGQSRGKPRSGARRRPGAARRRGVSQARTSSPA